MSRNSEPEREESISSKEKGMRKWKVASKSAGIQNNYLAVEASKLLNQEPDGESMMTDRNNIDWSNPALHYW